jgi:hypothetical protein
MEMEQFHTAYHTGRSGDEPLHARSPLRLRLALAGFGLAAAIAGIVVFTLADVPALVGVFAALAVLAVADAAVVLRHIHAGSDYQPGPEVPPYRPRRRTTAAKPPAKHEVAPGRRHAAYLWAAFAALVLIINAWTWIADMSTAAAAVLSIVAAVLLPLGVLSANVGSPTLQGNSVPGTGEGEAGAASEPAARPETRSEHARFEERRPEPEPAETAHPRHHRHRHLVGSSHR